MASMVRTSLPEAAMSASAETVTFSNSVVCWSCVFLIAAKIRFDWFPASSTL